ncbi:MAG: Hpt domain-containing protein, partial [Hydrogenophaga sp.]|nr:Hpt domain-containing protein [Hydrogenophaga sp.]
CTRLGHADARAEAAVPLRANWRRVPGGYAASAHRQLGGDAVLFRRVLARLLAERADWAALAPDGPRQWSESQATAWRARAHRLRGSAGMVGALALARAATALETALDAHATDEAAHALEALRQAFAELHTAAAGLDDSAAQAPAAPAAPLDEGRWRSLLQTLAAQLDANDLGASETFDALRPALAQRVGDATARAVAAAIDNLDFGAAREHLEPAMGEAEDQTAP